MKTHGLFLVVLALAFLLVVSGPGRAEPRTFTSTDGRQLVAEVVSVADGTASLKLGNGTVAEVPLSRFIKTDADYLSSWEPGADAAIKYLFDVAHSKERTDKSVSKDSQEKSGTETWVMNLKVRNRSGVDLKDVTLKYNIFYKVPSGQSSVLRKTPGTIKIESIRQNEELKLATEPVTLKVSELQGGWYYSDGSKRKQNDSLEGIAMTFVHEGAEGFTWASRGLPAGASGAPERRATASPD